MYLANRRKAFTGSNTETVSSANHNGSSQNFNMGNPASLQITGNMTVSIMVKFDTLASSQVFFGKFDFTNSQRAWQLSYELGTDAIVGLIDEDGPGGSEVVLEYGSPSTDTWYHVTMVYDGSDAYLYIDTAQEDTTAHSAGIHNSTADITVGRRDDATPGYLNGSTGFAIIWDNDISAAQVASLTDSNGNPKCYADLDAGLLTDMVSFWDLGNWDGSTGTEIEDKHGSNDATNVGTTPFTGTGLTVNCS